MPEGLDLHLRLEGQQAWLWLLPLLAAVVFLVYHRTRPPVSRSLRWVLVALRSAALGLLALILTEPVLGLWGKQVQRPGVLLLVDTSPTMGLSEPDGSRWVQVRRVLSQPDFGQALAQARVVAMGFAATPYPLSLDTLDRVQPAGQATDLAAAIRAGLEKGPPRTSLQAVLLVSDGAHNLGDDPVRAAADARVPVYCLSVGREERPADVQVVRAEAASAGYVGHPLSVSVEVRSWGYAGRPAEVTLREGESELARVPVVLADDGLVQQIAVRYDPPSAGPHILRVALQPQEGELSRGNNEALVFARVVQDRAKVLLVAAAPSVDLAFARRSLEADSSLAIADLVERQPGVLYHGNLPGAGQWSAWDVVVLFDPDPAVLAPQQWQDLAGWVEQGGGILFAGGPRSLGSWDPASGLAALLPATLPAGARFTARDVPLRLSQEGRRHPVTRPAVPDATEDPWAQLPPLPGFVPGVRKTEGAAALVEAATVERQPMVLAGPRGRGKAVAVLSGDLWRLDLISSGAGANPRTVRSFWRDAVRWLALPEPAGRVRTTTSRLVYRGGEQVAVAAQVYDELLRPQERATVQVLLAGREGPVLQLLDRGGGQYDGTMAGLPPGDYHYSAQAYLGDTMVGQDEGRFLVEPYDLESVDVAVRPPLLEEIAAAGGGLSRPLSDWRQITGRLALAPRLVEESRAFPLWGRWWALAIVLALLSAEWILRQRAGML